MIELHFDKVDIQKNFENSFWYEDYQKELRYIDTPEAKLSWYQHYKDMFLKDRALSVLKKIVESGGEEIILDQEWGTEHFPFYEDKWDKDIKYIPAPLEQDILNCCKLWSITHATISNGIVRIE